MRLGAHSGRHSSGSGSKRTLSLPCRNEAPTTTHRRNALGNLAGCLVGKGQYQNSTRIHALTEQMLDPPHQGFGLARARPGFQQERTAFVLCRHVLQIVERQFGGVGLLGKFDGGQQQRVEELLGHHRHRCAKFFGDLGGCHAFFQVQLPDHRAWQQELTCEQVHLDLSALSASVVYDPIDAYRRCLCGPGWVKVERRTGKVFLFAVA